MGARTGTAGLRRQRRSNRFGRFDHRYYRTKKRQAEIDLSYQDDLTGIHNRLYFEQCEDVRRRCVFASYYYACRHQRLKIVNAIGHAAGMLIIRTANLLKRCRDLLARIGGDEFAFILPLTDENEAYEMLKAIEKKGMFGIITKSITNSNTSIFLWLCHKVSDGAESARNRTGHRRLHVPAETS